MRYKTIILIFLLSACGKAKIHSVAEYKEWINNPKHGYTKEKYVDNIKIKVQYRPIEMMIANEVKHINNISDTSMDSLKKSYGNSRYFIMEIGYDERNGEKNADLVRAGAATYNAYSEKVQQLAFGLENNVRIVCGKDTVAPTLYNYERGYELGKKESFVFAFPALNTKEIIFIYADEIFGTGINKFQFEINDKDIPELSLKQ